jgi:hypothetical protein
MGRIYAVTFDGGSLLNADGDIDWFEITPADEKPVRLLGLFMAQTSDLGDAAEEVLVWNVLRGHTTSGSGGVTPTIDVVKGTDSAAGFTAEAINDVVASVATPDELHTGGWNVRIPLEFFWTPETAPEASQANTTIVVRQITTAADDLTGVGGTLYVEELG